MEVQPSPSCLALSPGKCMNAPSSQSHLAAKSGTNLDCFAPQILKEKINFLPYPIIVTPHLSRVDIRAVAWLGEGG